LVMGAWLQPDPLEAGDQPGRKSRRTLRSRPGGGQPYLRVLDISFQPGAAEAPPPPTTLGAPWERVCPLPPQKHGRSCGTSSTLQNQSSGGSDCDLQPTMAATVTCSYIVGWHRWKLGWGNLVTAPQALRHDDTTRRRRRHDDDDARPLLGERATLRG